MASKTDKWKGEQPLARIFLHRWKA